MVLSKTITGLFYVTNSVTADFEFSAAQLRLEHTASNRNKQERNESICQYVARTRTST
jgi:hypothetical protein